MSGQQGQATAKPPSVQPNLLPGWQPSLQPNLQLESPFLWPLLSMCSSSRSNTRVRKSGTPSLMLSRPQHASLQAVSWSFCGSHALVFASLVLCLLSSNRGGEATVTWGTFPRGCEGIVTRSRSLDKGVGNTHPSGLSKPAFVEQLVKLAHAHMHAIGAFTAHSHAWHGLQGVAGAHKLFRCRAAYGGLGLKIPEVAEDWAEDPYLPLDALGGAPTPPPEPDVHSRAGGAIRTLSPPPPFFLLWHPLSDFWWLPTNRHRLPTNRHRLHTNRDWLPTGRHRRAYWTLRVFFFSLRHPL